MDPRGVEIKRQQYQWQIWNHRATPRRKLCSHYTLPCFPLRKNTWCHYFHRWHKLQCYTTDAGESATVVDVVRNGHIHHQNVWFSLQVQFWPQVGYSSCNSVASYKELENALQRQYYQILTLGGFIRMASLNCRVVDVGFYCPGLSQPGVEALVAMTNKLLIHFGCRTDLGTLLRTSYSFLLLELGVLFQPLQSSYQGFSFLAMHSFMKMLWEKLDKFDIVVQTANSSF
jgi:hypothetical protein